MTASHAEARPGGRAGSGRWRASAAAALAAAWFVASGCRTPVAVHVAAPLEPLRELAPYVPDELDRAARDVAAAALAGDEERAAAAFARLREKETQASRNGAPPSGLVGAARHVLDAGLRDRRRYRRATRKLLKHEPLDPAFRHDLERELEDDPLVLADRRLRDARRARLAFFFNALAQPIGQSLLSLWMAPYRLLRSLTGLALAEHLADPISVPERQALVHWQRYLARHPDAPEAPRLRRRIHALEARWRQAQRDRALRAGRRAFDRGQWDLAAFFAERALRYAPEDREATRLRERALARLATLRAEERRSLAAPAQPPADLGDAAARALALALFTPGADLERAATALEAKEKEGPVAGAARYVRALALAEKGHESQAWRELEALAREPVESSAMARHAAAELESPMQNPYRAFREALGSDRGERLGWVFLGPLAHGPRDFDLPDPLEWTLEAPSFLEALAGLPNRLVRYAWLPPTAAAKRAGVYARRYLARHPQGEHVQEVRRWLVDFEASRGNWIAAYREARKLRPAAPDRVHQLAERAARQGLEVARKEKRRDLRVALLRRVAREYPETEAGREAGRQIREEIDKATAQRIRISRGFLLENPQVAGPRGLGLRPELLDGDPANGELAREGVTLVGGRVLEVALAPGPGQKEPERLRQAVSAERLARLVATLDEVSERRARVDPDAAVDPDANRDFFLERARLGATDTVDPRPAAQSSYAFLGMRERYGLVRKRESILPFDLVLRGSLPDLSLGAFPRIRPPRPTPDAFLYR